MSRHIQPGTVLAGRFRLDHLLGEGAFGQVWSAVQFPVERRVAVKLLHLADDVLMRKRFDYEARALATINHPNCVTLHDFGHDQGTAFLVTELVEGITLREWMKAGHPLPETLNVARQVAGALAAAHRHNVVHRDLKPENIMITHEGQRGWVVKVLDFGLSKILDDDRRDITKTGEVFGTPGYMSPEMLRGAEQIGGATDQYSFGVMLFEMLEGRAPFVAPTGFELSMKHLTDPAPDLSPSAPNDLRELVRTLLQKEPMGRFRTTDEMVAALNALGHEPARQPPRQVAPAPPTRQPVETSSPKPAERPAWYLVVPLVVALLVTIAAVIMLAAPDSAPVVQLEREKRINRIVVGSATPPTPPADPVIERTAPEGGSAGCGVEQKPGTQVISELDGLQNREVWVRVPPDYDRHRAYPVLVFFHESFQTPEQMFRATKFGEYADKRGFILVAPQDQLKDSWERPSSWDDAWYEIGLAKRHLCVDEQRIFFFGFGAGGWAAENLACAHDVRAVATHAHRLTLEEKPCEPTRPFPYLYMAPTKDGWDPVDGGETVCPTAAEKRPLKEHEGVLMDQRKCSAKRNGVARFGESECFSLEGCEEELRICHIEAGRFWPDLWRKIYNDVCDRRATKDFPYDDVLWDFIDAHDVE